MKYNFSTSDHRKILIAGGILLLCGAIVGLLIALKVIKVGGGSKQPTSYTLPGKSGGTTGGGTTSGGGTKPAKTAAHGSYTVKSGDTCIKIADALCNDGQSYADDICNSGGICSNLQAGATIKYDCGGQKQFCN